MSEANAPAILMTRVINIEKFTMTKDKIEKSSFTQFGVEDIEIKQLETPYQGYFKMLKYTFRHRCFAGTWSPVISRELFERGHAVAVLPYDPVTDQLILIEQVRIGAFAAGLSAWQLEIVAGVIDENESPEQVALREAKEEAGLSIYALHPITRYLSSSGGCSETISLYLGLVDASEAGGVFGLADENEDILVHTLSRKAALSLLDEGKIENAASIIALQWLALNRDKLLKTHTDIKPFGR